MEALSSTAFRRTFHKLTEPTLVNVLGHVIGVWSPIAHVRAGLGHPGDENHALAKVVEQEEEIRRLKRELAARPVVETPAQRSSTGARLLADQGGSFGHSRPAPKTPRRKKP